MLLAMYYDKVKGGVITTVAKINNAVLDIVMGMDDEPYKKNENDNVVAKTKCVNNWSQHTSEPQRLISPVWVPKTLWAGT